jgi:hypothetical protein
MYLAPQTLAKCILLANEPSGVFGRENDRTMSLPSASSYWAIYKEATMSNRREFLQTTAAFAGAFLLPQSLLATPAPNFHFIQSETLNHWPVLDPVQWSLEHAHQPILVRAAEGLSKLTVSDGDRIVRLVVRRCSLNLLEVGGNRVQVQFWGQQGQADLRPLFKSHGLARREVEVVLRDRKKEITHTTTGDTLLYGAPLASNFDLELFKIKCEGRFTQEADDWMAAPGTSSGFAWDGLADGSIPWAALKSAWHRGGAAVCQNCSGPTFLLSFGLRQLGMFNRAGFVEFVCAQCHRSFRDVSVNVKAWMAANLDADVRPSLEMVWGKRLKLDAKSLMTAAVEP